MNRPKYLRDYLAVALPGRVLQMRDPNDNARHRYQYASIEGRPCRRVMPRTGVVRDDPEAAWEPLNPDLVARISMARRLRVQRVGHPIVDFFLKLL